MLVPVGSNPTSATPSIATNASRGPTAKTPGSQPGDGGSTPPGTTQLGGWSNGTTPGLQPGDRGSTPRPVHSVPTTHRHGPLVQRNDTGIARRRSGFDSPAVHCLDGTTGPWSSGTTPPWRGGEPG